MIALNTKILSLFLYKIKLREWKFDNSIFSSQLLICWAKKYSRPVKLTIFDTFLFMTNDFGVHSLNEFCHLLCDKNISLILSPISHYTSSKLQHNCLYEIKQLTAI